MASQSLLVSSDPSVLGILRPLATEMDMEMDVRQGVSSALETIETTQYDTIIVDCDANEGALGLLAHLREQENGHKIIAVGITRDSASMQSVFDSGATFVLSKPLPVDDARRILRISQGVVTRAVRRFLRLPVETLVTVTLDDREEAIILNLSQRGMALQSSEIHPVGRMFYLAFFLPGTLDFVECAAQVMWADNAGRCGVEFRSLDDDSQRRVDRWVFQQAEKLIPGFSAPQGPEGMQTTKIPVSDPDAAAAALPVKPLAALLLGLLLDVLVVAAGAGLFFLFGVIAGQSAGSLLSWVLALLAGLVFWTAYRFLFHFFRVTTPGRKAAHRLLQRED